MQLLPQASIRNVLLTTAAFLAVTSASLFAQDDPPDQVGRISYVTGNVNIQQVGSDDWGQALPNLPFGPGDRVVTDRDGRAEIQIGQTFIRIGANSDVSFIEDSPHSISVGLAQGSVHAHSFALWPGQRFHVNTPNGSGGVDTSGEELRVDVMPGEDASIFTDIGIQAFAGGPGMGGVNIHPGQAVELFGSNPVTPQWLQAAPPDDLDFWSQSRDQQIRSSASYRYVSPEIGGAFELDAAGDWMPDTPFGPIWFPRVPFGWAPYHNGHWINHAPWGWVWIEDEPWGYAPFHYGRWVSWEGRWGWIPGPPAAHPVWSPALVAFAGGIQVGGSGVSAWFPLGPGEVYRPWYHASPRYFDRVNVTNLRESPRVHVQDSYINFDVDHVIYVNRMIGVSAMRHEDFAAGRSAQRAPIVVDVHLFDHPQILERPVVQPPAHPFAGHPPVRPVHVSAERPAVLNEQGKLVTSRPGAQPVEPPVKPASPVRPLTGHTVIAPPAGVKPADAKPAGATTPAAAPAAKTAEKPVDKSAKPVAPAPTSASKPASKPAATPTAVSPAKPAANPPVKPTAPVADKSHPNKKDEKKKEN